MKQMLSTMIFTLFVVTTTHVTLPMINFKETANQLQELAVEREIATKQCQSEWQQLFLLARQAPYAIESLERAMRTDAYRQCMDRELGAHWKDEDKEKKHLVFTQTEEMFDERLPLLKALLYYGRLLTE